MINISLRKISDKYVDVIIRYDNVTFDGKVCDKYELEELLHDLGSAVADIRDLLERDYL